MKLQKFRDPQLDTTGDRVGFYPREFYPLDNFSAFQVDWHGHRCPTSEHAYQAEKFLDTAPDITQLILNTRSPHEAQKLAGTNKDQRRADWSDVKAAIMTDILRAKLSQNPYVRQKLLETLDLEIVEDSPKDDFWGWGPNRHGRNELGKIWMRLRTELQSGQ